MALIPLSKSDPAKLHPDAFDVRGWEVRTEADDDRAGSVDDVLMDGVGTPHLLDVDLGWMTRHVLVPLSQAWADASRRVVWIEGLRKEDLKQMPSYDHRPDEVTTELEGRLVDDYAAVAHGAARRSAVAIPAEERLVRMGKGKEFQVAKGSSDPRGWKVVGGDGTRLGEVVELIVDRERMRARYLDVDVDEEELQLERVDRHVLLPVERARLDHKHSAVVMDGLFGRDLGAYPVFTGLPLAKGSEQEIESCFRGPEVRSHGWVEGAARRFFGGTRRAGSAGQTGVPQPPAPPVAGREAAAPEPRTAPGGETVIRPEEGDEVRIRVRRGDIIIEKHTERGSDDG